MTLDLIVGIHHPLLRGYLVDILGSAYLRPLLMSASSELGMAFKLQWSPYWLYVRPVIPNFDPPRIFSRVCRSYQVNEDPSSSSGPLGSRIRPRRLKKSMTKGCG